MKYRPQDSDDFVEFKVRLDLETVAWLMELADLNHAPPAVVLASIIRDTCEDDRAAEFAEIAQNAPTTEALN